ncbi:MAG: glycosyltransferase family 39 protein [Candidatus Rokubacteria bacterium]|nr:glycosyltransferase family 39 protein [Candidatus Rokubacteria bacterium]
MWPDVRLDGIASEAGEGRAAGRAAAGSAGLALALWALLLGASLGGLTALYDRSFIGIDGAFFVNAAKNLASGHGFATSIVWHEEQYRLGGVPAPQTVFPPGYPLLIALGSRLGLDPPYAAFLVSLLSFGAVALVIYDILRTAGHTPLRSFAVSAVWLGSPFAWFNVLGCMSEMPFTLLTLVSLRCAMQGERDPGRRDLWLAAAGTVAGLAFTVRYQGVYYVISLGLFFLVRVIRQRDWQSARALILATGPASVFVVALFLRNLVLTGKLTGTMLPGDPLMELHRTVGWALGGIFGFTKSGLLGGSAPEVAFVIVAAAGLVGGVCWIGRLKIDRSALRAALAETHVSLSLAYMAVSIILMVQGARNYASGHISPRYLLALIPFGLLCLADGVRVIRFTPSRSRHAWAARLWVGAAVVTLLAGQVNVFHHHWRPLTQANPYRTIRDALEGPLAGEPLVLFLRQRVTTASPLLGNEAQMLGAVLDRPVLGLTQAAYTRRVWTDDQVRRLVASYGVAYVIFFPGLFDPTHPSDGNRPFFQQLERGDVPPWLVAVLAAPDVRLYRVDGAAVAGSPGELVHARRGG